MTLYALAKGLFRLQFKVMGWKIKGLENVPKEGPLILVINHVSFWDPVLAGSGFPRQVSYMAKEELFKVPILGGIIRRLGAFPVRRGAGDTSAIRQSLAVLKEGKVLGLFPEGTRSKSGEIQKGLPGMVLLMEKSKAPILPVKVYGTKNLLIKGWGKLGMTIGKPITADMLQPPAGVENRREWIANRIMETLQQLPES